MFEGFGEIKLTGRYLQIVNFIEILTGLSAWVYIYLSGLLVGIYNLKLMLSALKGAIKDVLLNFS